MCSHDECVTHDDEGMGTDVVDLCSYDECGAEAVEGLSTDVVFLGVFTTNAVLAELMMLRVWPRVK